MSRLSLWLIAAAMLLPILSLIPLGSYWLWQNGLLVPWAVAALVTTGLLYGSAALRLRLHSSARPTTSPQPQVADEGSIEDRANAAIEDLIAKTEPGTVANKEALFALGSEAIERVAREFHPTSSRAVWAFTVPEALLLTERVSARLRPAFMATVPLGERVTVGQLLQIYGYRSLFGTAEKLYDLWRIVRVFNPIAAVTQEARERVTRQVISSVRDDMTKRLLTIYLREVGRAAIELYSGRLRSGREAELSAEQRPKANADQAGEDRAPAQGIIHNVAKAIRAARLVNRSRK